MMPMIGGRGFMAPRPLAHLATASVTPCAGDAGAHCRRPDRGRSGCPRPDRAAAPVGARRIELSKGGELLWTVGFGVRLAPSAAEVSA